MSWKGGILMGENGKNIVYQKIPGEIFVEALTNAIQTMTGFIVEANAAYDESNDEKDIVGAIVLYGEKKLLLTLMANRNTALLLTAYMTGMDIDELTDNIICDSITEFINIVGGSARAALADSNYSFKITVPFTITGKGVQLMVKKRTDRFIVGFNSNEVKLCLKIIEL